MVNISTELRFTIVSEGKHFVAGCPLGRRVCDLLFRLSYHMHNRQKYSSYGKREGFKGSWEGVCGKSNSRGVFTSNSSLSNTDFPLFTCVVCYLKAKVYNDL